MTLRAILLGLVFGRELQLLRNNGGGGGNDVEILKPSHLQVSLSTCVREYECFPKAEGSFKMESHHLYRCKKNKNIKWRIIRLKQN